MCHWALGLFRRTKWVLHLSSTGSPLFWGSFAGSRPAARMNQQSGPQGVKAAWKRPHASGLARFCKWPDISIPDLIEARPPGALARGGEEH